MQGQRKFGFNFTLVLTALLMVLVLVLGGCGKKDNSQAETGNSGVSQEEESGGSETKGNDPDISSKPAQTLQKVKLYFSDDQAMYLISEEREVVKDGDETLEEIIVRELIAGPQSDKMGQVMPDGTQLLSVSVVNGVAFVNFSKEFQTKHWGGSAGETMTLYAVVNSLCELPGIEKVQFLLEGDKQDSILGGNMDTSVPTEPDYDMVKQ